MRRAVVFPGQGSQIIGMGKDLYNNFASAREVFTEVDNVMGAKLSHVIFEGPEEDLVITSNTQPALMAVSMAIMNVLERDFDAPIETMASFVAGHSLGEYTALCATRSISLVDCTRLLKARGRAMMEASIDNPGAMAAIMGGDIGTIQGIVEKSNNGDGEICVIANDNTVGQVVISGSVSGIEKAIALAWDHDIKRTIKLPVSGAFHSPLMKGAQPKLEEALEGVEIKKPVVPVVSNVTAEPIDEKDIKGFLVRQLTGTVRFRESLLYMKNKGAIGQIVEIGAGKVLAGLSKRTLADVQALSLNTISDIEEFAKSLGV